MAGHIQKRGENTWRVTVFLGEESGKPVRHRKTIHGTKKDADRYLTATLRERDLGRFAEPAKVARNAYLDRWLEAAAKPRLRESTFRGYADLLRLHVRPALGSQRLDKLAPVAIQTLYGNLLKKGLSARTVRYVHAVLSSALKQAVKWQMIPGNPAEYVDLPRQQRKEQKALGPEVALRFMDAARQDRWGILFVSVHRLGSRC